MTVPPELLKEIESCAARHGVELVDLIVRGHHGNRVYEFFIDNEQGVTLKVCSDLSRELQPALDRFEGGRGYHLMVSSPGLDRPLLKPWQFSKHVGKALRVKHKVPEGEIVVNGTLARCDLSAITLMAGKEKQEISIRFENVVEARVVTPW